MFILTEILMPGIRKFLFQKLFLLLFQMPFKSFIVSSQD